MWLQLPVTKEYIEELQMAERDLRHLVLMGATNPSVSADNLRIKLIELSLLTQQLNKLENYASTDDSLYSDASGNPGSEPDGGPSPSA